MTNATDADLRERVFSAILGRTATKATDNIIHMLTTTGRITTEWDCKVAEQSGYDRAIAEVVAWLRTQKTYWPSDIADAIEAGEQRKGAE